MKKAIVVCIVMLLVLGLASDGYCQNALRKLGRGVANVALCPVEIPLTMMNTYVKDQGYVESVVFGLPNGIMNMIVRCAVGAYETVTFLFPFPEDYRSMIEPEFVWSSGRDETGSIAPHL